MMNTLRKHQDTITGTLIVMAFPAIIIAGQIFDLCMHCG
jgi:hypothetical protein